MDKLPGWTELIDELMRTAPRVAACLMEGLPSVDQERGVLTVAFARDKAFQVKSLQADNTCIAETASRIWNCTLRVDLVLGQTGQSRTGHEEIRQEVAPTMSEELDKARQGDPMLDQLVDSMDGEPVSETEQDKWKKRDS